MKRNNLRKTAKLIEESSCYDLSDGCHCIAAHAAKADNELYTPGMGIWNWRHTKKIAKAFLGLTVRQMDALFYPKKRWGVNSPRILDAALAARVLRRLARTGKIIWR